VSDNEVELYPLSLKIMRQAPPPEKDDGAEPKTIGLKAEKPPPVHFFFRHETSRGQTVRELIKSLCLAQTRMANKIKGARANSVRLWDYRIPAEPKLLDDDTITIEDGGFEENSALLMEVQNEDLSWPSELFALATSKAGKNVETRVGVVDAKRENGMTGLSNLGNTCYLNAALQCLSNTDVLTEYFNQNCHYGEINKDNFMGSKGAVARAYGNLIRQMWCGKVSVAPVKLRAAVNAHAPQFVGNEQHDSQELLSSVIDTLHEDLNRVKKKPYVERKDSDGRPDCVVAKESWEGHLARNQSVVVDLFHGQIKSVLTCKTCKFSNVSFDAFSTLTLPLPTENSAVMDVVVRSLSDEIPSHYSVEVERDATYHDLKVQLALMSSIPIERLAFVDALGTLGQKIPVDTTKPTGRTSMMLTCYEVEPLDTPSVEHDLLGPDADTTDPDAAPAPPRAPKTAQAPETAQAPASTTAEPAAAATPETPTETTEAPAVAAAAAEPAPAIAGSKPQSNPNSPVSSRTASPVPPPTLDGTLLPGHLVVVHRRQDQHGVHLLTNTIKSSVFGNAFFCVNTPTLTVKELHRDVWLRAKRFIRATSADVPEKFPFTLKMVDASGSRCSRCRWNRFCLGCPILNDEVPLATDLVSIAIDWDPTVLHLSYDYAEEAKLSAHESVAAFRKKAEEPIKLEDCLKAFTKEEEMGMEDSWYCSNCKEQREATKKLEIWTLPPVLIVHLKRFHNVNGRWVKSQRHVKMPLSDVNIFDHLTPPTYVDCTPQTSSPEAGSAAAMPTAAAVDAPAPIIDSGGGDEPPASDSTVEADAGPSPSPTSTPAPAPALAPLDNSVANDDPAQGGSGGGARNTGSDQPNLAGNSTGIMWDKIDPHAQHYVDPNCDRIYDLSAMSIHLGIMGGGHYVAYGKNPNSQWVFFNDSSAKDVPEERVGKENGYCLFYTARGLNTAAFLPEKREGQSDEEEEEGRASPEAGEGRNCTVM
jgi:ubiquitin carboxyl-terminal hydrolase 6/32